MKEKETGINGGGKEKEEAKRGDRAKKAEEELQPGAFFITFTKRLPNLSENWDIRDGFRRLMSWGIATIYIHRKNLSTRISNE